MSEREFYRVILGLQDPWEISEVKLDAAAQKVEVVVVYKQGTLWACPESQQKLPIHDHVERSWLHLDTCQFETILVCRVPRLQLPDGKVWTVPGPWAEARKVLPKAKLVHERFHVSKLLGDAVDKVRRGESKELAAQDDERLRGCHAF